MNIVKHSDSPWSVNSFFVVCIGEPALCGLLSKLSDVPGAWDNNIYIAECQLLQDNEEEHGTGGEDIPIHTHNNPASADGSVHSGVAVRAGLWGIRDDKGEEQWEEEGPTAWHPGIQAQPDSQRIYSINGIQMILLSTYIHI